ncbi:MAG TPA: FlgD immunoglobulin-like domain containing protein [Candidatus Angelobacter sp.]|nr:FlgD immunoglobulin-like domain containing protein [Candidatus Angelobacter sp.]
MFDGSTEMPTQFKVMARWGGDSANAAKPIKWLKITWFATVGANAVKTYALKTGGSAPGANLASLSGGVITVNTGVLRATFDERHPKVFDDVRWDTLGVFGTGTRVIHPDSVGGSIVEISGTQYSQSADSLPITRETDGRFEIEENGALMCVVRIEGRHRATPTGAKSLGYVTRVFFYKNKSYLRVAHANYNGQLVASFQSSFSDTADDVVSQNCWYNFGLTLAGSVGYTLGKEHGATPLSGTFTAGAQSYINADNCDTTTSLQYTYVDNGGSPVAAAQRAEGWGDVRGTDRGVFICDRWFWQRYEKRLTLTQAPAIRLDLQRSRTFREATGLGDELVLWFHRPDITQRQMTDMAFGFAKSPLYAYASSAHYLGTGAFEPLSAQSGLAYPNCGSNTTCLMQYDLDSNDSLAMAYRESDLLYGGLNFGGFLDQATVPPGTSRDNMNEHGVNYYDGIYTIANNFARRADIEVGSQDGLQWMRLLTEAARHTMETEQYHVYRDNGVGGDPPGTRYNFNGLMPAYQEFYRNNVHIEHCWGSGLEYYYFLTGDERGKERFIEGAVSLALNDSITSGGGNVPPFTQANIKLGRLGGQAMDWLARAYRMTNNPVFGTKMQTVMDSTAAKIIHLANFRDYSMRQVVGIQLPAMYIAWAIDGGTGHPTWKTAGVKIADWTIKEDRNPTTHLIEGDGFYGNYLGDAGVRTSGECTNRVWFISTGITARSAEAHWTCYPATHLELMGGMWAATRFTGNPKYRNFLARFLYKDRLQDMADQLSPECCGFTGFGRSHQSLRNQIHLNAIMNEWRPTAANPESDALSQNRPNPFNPETLIPYSLASGGKVTIRIYDISGRCIRTLVDAVTGPGPHQARWDGGLDSGRKAPSGIYFYKITCPDGTSSARKMAILR